MERWIEKLRQADQELRIHLLFDGKYQPSVGTETDFLCIFDREHKFLFMNFVGARQLDLDPLVVEGRHWRELGLPADTMEELDKLIDQVFVTGNRPRGVSKPFQTQAGVRFFEHMLSPLYRAENEIGAVLCSVRDVTGLINTQMALRAARQSLVASEARYRMLFDNVNDAVFLLELDAAGKPLLFRDVNDLACRRLGYSREELLGLSLADINAQAEQDRSMSIRRLRAAQSATFETTHRAKDGTLFPVELSARYFIADGAAYILAVARDLTRRRRSEGLVKKAAERKKRNDILNELVKGSRLAEQGLRELMRRADIDPGEAFTCYLLVVDKWQGKPREYWQEHFDDLRSLQDAIVEGLEDRAEWVAWASAEGVGVLHFGLAAGKDVGQYQAEVGGRLRKQVADRIPGVALAIGVAEAATEITDLGLRYRQSCLAVDMGRKMWPAREIYHYLDLGVFQLIPFIEDQEQVSGYIERTLGKLLHYDKQKRDEYLLTLEVILESDNLKEAAKKVFVHQKTIELRKRRIEEILGVSLAGFETRMALATALKLRKLDNDKWRIG